MYSNIQTLGKQFIAQFYQTLASNRFGLIDFFTDFSHLTYNGQEFHGLKDIAQKIESFSFQQISHEYDNPFVQPGPVEGSIVVSASGKLTMDGNVYHFSECFVLCPNGQGGYYCHNDIFTLFG